MSVRDQIMSDVKDAMRAKEMQKLQTLRGLQAAIKNKEIEVRPAEVTDKDVLDVLKKMAKQRKDSIEQFEAAQRADLADQEKIELKIIEAYLPEEMSEAQIKAIVLDVVKETGATSMKDMKTVMQAVMERTAGAADNKIVSGLVKDALQG